MNEVKKGCFIIIETDHNQKPIKPEGQIVKRTFDTVKQAEAFIMDDAMNTIYSDKGAEFKVGEDNEWGSDHIICQVVKIVRPVPIMSPSVSIMEVKA
jgi:hypothetical protein